MLRRAKAAEKQNNLDLAIEDLATACIVEAFQNNVTVSELDRIAKATGKGLQYLRSLVQLKISSQKPISFL